MSPAVLTLYSFGPAANSLKPTLTLYEKGLEFEHKLLDPSNLEHHSDWFKAINPRGQVPARLHELVPESDGVHARDGLEASRHATVLVRAGG